MPPSRELAGCNTITPVAQRLAMDENPDFPVHASTAALRATLEMQQSMEMLKGGAPSCKKILKPSGTLTFHLPAGLLAVATVAACRSGPASEQGQLRDLPRRRKAWVEAKLAHLPSFARRSARNSLAEERTLAAPWVCRLTGSKSGSPRDRAGAAPSPPDVVA
eukprot:7383870-Prymnesium_polylepis.1